MEPADHCNDLGERPIGREKVVMAGVDDFAFDVIEYLATLFIDPAHTRRTVKAESLQVTEESMNAGRPGAGRPMDGVIDSHNRFVGVAACECLLHQARIRRQRQPRMLGLPDKASGAGSRAATRNACQIDVSLRRCGGATGDNTGRRDGGLASF